MCLAPPEPHPLDFDWRYTEETVEEIISMLPSNGNILAVGAPSIARRLEELNRRVTLIDRQPYQKVKEHIISEVELALAPEKEYTAAIIDPPWYTDDILSWISTVARFIGPGKPILASVWPKDMRPTSDEEEKQIFDWLSGWAASDFLQFQPKYSLPLFEKWAQKVGSHQPLAFSPKVGRLLKVIGNLEPRPISVIPKRGEWVRFVIDDYQLALRLNISDKPLKKIGQHPSSDGWIWPYVSARAESRNSINLWSSCNEVAIVGNPHDLLDVLWAAASTSKKGKFEALLSQYSELLEWEIPRPPYRRVFKWIHQY